MFKIRSFPKKNLKWWHGKTTSIDFNPDFQRKPNVWKSRDKLFLIDSILNSFDIPKVYIADFTTHDVPALNVQKKKYAVIDGKQRLTTINAFMNGELTLPKKFFLLSDPTTPIGGLTFSELKKQHPQVAKKFEKYVLDVKSIETDDRERINDVFRRLNKAAASLNGAELRNSMIGKAVDAIRNIAEHRFFENRIRFATNRSQERNAAAKILILEYNGGAYIDTKKKNLDAFVNEVGAHGSGKFNGALKRVMANMDALADVFLKKDPLLGAQGHVPIYYMFVARLKAADRKKVRKFLERFERERVKNRNAGLHNRDLDDYDLASRSTNDRKSFETRLRIIRKRFAAWKKTQEGQAA